MAWKYFIVFLNSPANFFSFNYFWCAAQQLRESKQTLGTLCRIHVAPLRAMLRFCSVLSVH